MFYFIILFIATTLVLTFVLTLRSLQIDNFKEKLNCYTKYYNATKSVPINYLIIRNGAEVILFALYEGGYTAKIKVFNNDDDVEYLEREANELRNYLLKIN
jgi:hypothetical protein